MAHDVRDFGDEVGATAHGHVHAQVVTEEDHVVDLRLDLVAIAAGERRDGDAFRPNDDRRPRARGAQSKTHRPDPETVDIDLADPVALAHDDAVQAVVLADEAGDESLLRFFVQDLRRRRLLDHPVVEHRHPVGERHRLLLVVGHVDDGHAQGRVNPPDLVLHLLAQAAVESAQRFVHQDEFRFEDESTGDRHALLLAARQLRRLPVLKALELHQAERTLHPLPPKNRLDSADLERKGQIAAHRHVREQGVVLEHHADAPLVGRQIVNRPAADPDRARRRRLESGEHHQAGRLAGAGRPEQSQELASFDLQVQAPHHEVAAVVALVYANELNVGDGALAALVRDRDAHGAVTILGNATLSSPIDFRTHPDRYRHWRLKIEPPLAFLTLEVDEQAGLRPGYQLKQNSYDLGVDFELYDATQRLRFEHPQVHAVVLRSDRDRIFCAGANIGMLGASSHQLKVNFCKFTNETRLAIEDACQHSGQRYLCAVRGTAAGGGYELALACDRILLADDGSSAVSLPEVPLLGVLPGTGGLTRLLDKRRVRRDRVDLFCTLEEGIKGRRAVEWNLVDELLPRSSFDEDAAARALELAAGSDRPADADGVAWPEIAPELESDSLVYSTLRIDFDRELGAARLTVLGPTEPPAGRASEALARDAVFWPLILARELDDALLHLRLNETRIGQLVIQSRGDLEAVAAFDALLHRERGHWLVREVLLYWKRVLKRLDLTARSVFTLIEPGSCFTGFLFELALAADRSYMFEGEAEDGGPAPQVALGELNFGAFPTPNGLSRIATRFLGQKEEIEKLRSLAGTPLEAEEAERAGLVTEILDDLDWEDEVRIALEERASFSPDALTALEANLRFPGPETMESRIFGRLSAWQNWIFQRPNAVGEEGALRLYGTGRRPRFDRERI